ncbi:hypothetical protein D3C71_1948450 [compost metagenome]
MVLGVTADIENSVKTYLQQSSIDYRVLTSLVPLNGTGQDGINNSSQAVSYAVQVKITADLLKQEGIETIDLYLNCPFGLAVFVGHYLTAVSPVKIFDYMNPGYTTACTI